jgi:hypothetical protein
MAGTCTLAGYADDFVITFKHHRDAKWALEVLGNGSRGMDSRSIVRRAGKEEGEPYASRGTLPPACKARFRPAAWAFTARESNPWIATLVSGSAMVASRMSRASGALIRATRDQEPGLRSGCWVRPAAPFD